MAVRSLWSGIRLVVPLVLSICPTARAEDSPALANASSLWSAGPATLSGLVDGYFSLNFNHPRDRNSQLRAFDVKTSQFTLNMVRLTMEHAADPVGFRVDLGFGRAFDLYHFNEPDFTAMKFVQQAFLSWKPPKGRGFQADFGKFVTWAGAEVFETSGNWNYSRSLLYTLVQPYYHCGLRTSMPIGGHFTGGVQIVNGWNNVEDNNTGKTVGVTGAVAGSKASWANTYYVGPEKDGTNAGRRQLWDSVFTAHPHPKAHVYLNFDYLVEARAGGGRYRVVGLGGAARYQWNPWFAIAPRWEWVNDADGFSTGISQKIKEFTLTGELKMKEGLLARLEYRCDWSNQPFFNRGNQAGAGKNQNTALVGFVAFFGPKR